ncbi:MAG: energy transducer TonB [Limisphaerales bacterium]
MRDVFRPPQVESGWVRSVMLGLGLVVLVFGILPFTTAISTARQKQLMVTRVDVSALPPEVAPDEPPPPPPEEKEEEPPPELADAPETPLDLNINLDVALGSGGAMAMGLGAMGGDGMGSGLDAFDVSDLERRPEAVSQVSPVYPAALRKARIEGTVTLVFLLTEAGTVEDPRVENSTHPEFEKPAVDALRRWRFKPGMREGQAVKTFMRLPMRFRISG